jgi:hypothetical protein
MGLWRNEPLALINTFQSHQKQMEILNEKPRKEKEALAGN